MNATAPFTSPGSVQVSIPSGEIILIMNTAKGFDAVRECDVYPGWHGGPSKADTRVPIAILYPGLVLEDGNQWLRDLPETVAGSASMLRNRHVTPLILKPFEQVEQ